MFIISAATINIDESDADSATNEDDSDTTSLINQKPKHAVWSFAYYQEFFDVDTATVINRIKSSLIPIPSSGFTRQYVKGKPDIYGPFWICATLVLCVGIFGNLSTLFSNLNNKNYRYKPQFELLPIAALIIYCYTFVLPLLIKGLFWWKNGTVNLAVSQIICLYGYSLFVFIPASVLFIVPYALFNWIVVAAAVCVSGSGIMLSLWPAFDIVNRKIASVIMLSLFAVHVATMVTLRLYFFSPTASSSAEDIHQNVTATTKSNVV